MVLRKLADAIRTQNWFSVSIELAIVVLGILIGLRVNDWADQRATERLYRTALTVFLEESKANRELLDHTIGLIESRTPALEQSVAGLVRCEAWPDAGKTLNEVIGMSYRSIRPEQAFVAYQAVSSNPRFQEAMSADFRRALNRYHTQFVASYEWMRRNAETIDPAMSFENASVVAIRETGNHASTLARFQLQLDAPFASVCADPVFVHDLWNFHAIHAINLGMSRTMQQRRDAFDEALRDEIDRIESRVGAEP